MKPFRLVLALGLTVLGIAACSGGSSGSPVGDDDDDAAFLLTNGSYDFVIDSVPADTCWAPPKTLPEVPMTITGDFAVNGDAVTITIDDPTLGTQTLELTKDGNALTGGGSGDANTGLGDCVLHVVGVFDGTMTADDAFDAEMTIDLSTASGDCSIVQGDLLNEQLSTLPCHLELTGAGTKN